MLKSLLYAVTLISVARPAISEACLHEVERVVESESSIVARAEKAFGDGRYDAARRILEKHAVTEARLKPRAQDVVAVAKIRMPRKSDDLAKAVAHLEMRSTAAKKDMRLRAWLAEGYVAVGRKDDARAILTDLNSRDLMPDAYAYLALAKVSEKTERLAAWKACRTKAKSKDLCELPAEVRS